MRRRRGLTWGSSGVTTFFKSIGFGLGFGITTVTELIGDDAIDFGALTLAGDGGMPKSTGTITGGSASGYTLSGGFVTPTTNGSADAGTIEFSDTTTWTMSIVADAYSAKDHAEWNSLMKTTGMVYGQTILLRAGTYDKNSASPTRPKAITGTFVRHSNQDAANYQGRDVTSGSYVTVKPHTGDTVLFENTQVQPALYFDNNGGTAKGIRFTGITFSRPLSGGASPSVWVIDVVGEDLTFDNCTIQALGFVFAPGNISHSGIQSDGDFCTIQDCSINGVNTGIQIADGTDPIIVGNTILDSLADAIHYSMQVSNVDNLVECWNDIYRKDATIDTGVHSDWTQAFGLDAASPNWARVGNRYFVGKVKESVFSSGQGLFTTPGLPDGRQVNHIIAGNFIAVDVARGTTDGWIEGIEIYHNTIISDFGDVISQGSIFIENIQADGPDSVDVVIRNNVSPRISLTDVSTSDLGNNDLSLDATSASYTALFADPKGEADLTLANIAASFAPKVGGALDVADHLPIIGCLPVAGRTAMVDFDARTVDFPFQEADFTPILGDLIDVALSAAVEASDKIEGIDAAGTGAECWITGGNSPTMEIRQSDNSTVIIGSVPVGEHHIVYRDEWIHINDTASGTNSTQFDVVLNIGIKSDTFSHTTVAA